MTIYNERGATALTIVRNKTSITIIEHSKINDNDANDIWSMAVINQSKITNS